MKREKLMKGMGWKRKIKDERKKGWDKRMRKIKWMQKRWRWDNRENRWHEKDDRKIRDERSDEHEVDSTRENRWYEKEEIAENKNKKEKMEWKR